MLALLVLVVLPGFGIPKETKLKPTAVFAGSHSAIRHETFNVIATEEGWQRLWKEHRGEKHDPEFTETEQELDIDFDTNYVVAVFTGRWDWCRVTPQLRGEAVVIGFRATGYGIEGRPPFVMPVRADNPMPRAERAERDNTKRDSKGPYAFVVLPKPVRTVVIEVDVQNTLGDPPVWERRFLFPAPKGAK